ncbi:MAG: cobalamin B12-binding domain-containing protein [Herpetosiphonaceae bacterium]|nr:cobalamin B12-binding domain-containing protein [Herpetosiphonaceae bacterium]
MFEPLASLEVVLLQLPVPNNPQANVPLAAGYLKAYAGAQGLLDHCTITLLPRTITDHGGDALIVAEVVARRPALLGLSLYTWNSERSLHLASLIKAQLPDLLVVVGGPEVQSDNDWVLEHPAVDIAVLGEGEQTFCDLLRWQLQQRHMAAFDAARIPLEASTRMAAPLTLAAIPGIAFHDSGQLIMTEPRKGLDDLQVVPSPYLQGYLTLAPGDMAFVECSRWCPYHCTFCLYGRNMGSKLGKRYFGAERVAAEVAWAKAQGASAVHFVEANLNLLPYFRQLMIALSDINADRRLPLYAELRGEHLSDEVIGQMVQVGLTVAEVGLQSANPRALQAVERRTDLVKWAAGTRRLYHAGVEVLLDVILGLPADDTAGVEYTLQWIKAEQLGAYDIFILQVLPGTTVRERAAQYQLRFQERPPYYVLATDRLDYTDLRALRWELKLQAGFDPQSVEGMPELELGSRPSQAESLVAHYVLDCIADQDWAALGAQIADHVTAHFTLFVHNFDPTVVRTFAWPIAEANLTIHWDIVICGLAPEPTVLHGLHQAWPHQIGYLDRVAVYQQAQPEPPYRKVTPRWTLLLRAMTIDPLRYEGIAHIVWEVEAEQLAAQLAALERHGGAGILVHGGDEADREIVRSWQQEIGWPAWWSDDSSIQ